MCRLGVMPIVDLSGFLIGRAPPVFLTRDLVARSEKQGQQALKMELFLGKFPGSRCHFDLARPAGGFWQLLYAPLPDAPWLASDHHGSSTAMGRPDVDRLSPGSSPTGRRVPPRSTQPPSPQRRRGPDMLFDEPQGGQSSPGSGRRSPRSRGSHRDLRRGNAFFAPDTTPRPQATGPFHWRNTVAELPQTPPRGIRTGATEFDSESSRWQRSGGLDQEYGSTSYGGAGSSGYASGGESPRSGSSRVYGSPRGSRSPRRGDRNRVREKAEKEAMEKARRLQRGSSSPRSQPSSPSSPSRGTTFRSTSRSSKWEDDNPSSSGSPFSWFGR
eukprot:SM000300S11716  [mRNA]  locus=s300:103013:104205:- [translate_table: standard]